jgi:hypothetical protein
MDPTERTGRLSRDERRAQTRERLTRRPRSSTGSAPRRLPGGGRRDRGLHEGRRLLQLCLEDRSSSPLAERRSIYASIDAQREQIVSTPLADFVDGMGETLRAHAAPEEARDDLTIEVWLAAMRDPSLRSVIAHDYRQMRAEFGPLIAAKLVDEGLETPFTGEELGTLVSAIGSGLILQHYLEPGAVDPELLHAALRRLLGLPPRPAERAPRDEAKARNGRDPRP